MFWLEVERYRRSQLSSSLAPPEQARSITAIVRRYLQPSTVGLVPSVTPRTHTVALAPARSPTPSPTHAPAPAVFAAPPKHPPPRPPPLPPPPPLPKDDSFIRHSNAVTEHSPLVTKRALRLDPPKMNPPLVATRITWTDDPDPVSVDRSAVEAEEAVPDRVSVNDSYRVHWALMVCHKEVTDRLSPIFSRMLGQPIREALGIKLSPYLHPDALDLEAPGNRVIGAAGVPLSDDSSVLELASWCACVCLRSVCVRQRAHPSAPPTHPQGPHALPAVWLRRPADCDACIVHSV